MSRRHRVSFAALLAFGVAVAPLAASAPAAAASLEFDGVDDSAFSADPLELTGALTIEAWIQVESATAAGRIVSNRNAANGYEFNLWDGGGENAELWFGMNGNLEIVAPFPRALFGVWTHVAVTYEGPPVGTMKLYIDGDEVASSLRDAAMNPTTGPFRIGAIGNGQNFFFHGRIDEVRAWSRVLSGSDIAAWRSVVIDGSHPNFADLEAYWRFEEGMGQVSDSEVGGSLREVTLGLTPSVDSSDPAWSSDNAVAVVPATFSSIKAGVGRPRR